MNQELNEVSFETVVAMLRDDSIVQLPATTFYRLSALAGDEVETMADAWGTLPDERRQWLLRQFHEASEANFDMDFSRIADIALDDVEDETRRLAIVCLWEGVSPALLRRLTQILSEDPSTEVRQEAASALGRFVLQAELGKLSEELTLPAENLLLNILEEGMEPLDVRRRALESLSYCGREEVASLIEDAYYHANSSMRASALLSMGRSANDAWEGYVLQELVSDEPVLRYEAAYAAGELELEDAVLVLGELLAGEDVELQTAAIWSLGEIGGADARSILQRAQDTLTNEDLLEALDDALASSSMGDGRLELPLDDMLEDGPLE